MREIDELFIGLFERKTDCGDDGESMRAQRCAIILDFSRLTLTTLELSQVQDLSALMARYGFHNLVSVPPQENIFGQSMAVGILNSAIPLFGRRGIRVHIAKTQDEAIALAKRFPCFID
jgi:hypothetical protein